MKLTRTSNLNLDRFSRMNHYKNDNFLSKSACYLIVHTKSPRKTMVARIKWHFLIYETKNKPNIPKSERTKRRRSTHQITHTRVRIPRKRTLRALRGVAAALYMIGEGANPKMERDEDEWRERGQVRRGTGAAEDREWRGSFFCFCFFFFFFTLLQEGERRAVLTLRIRVGSIEYWFGPDKSVIRIRREPEISGE